MLSRFSRAGLVGVSFAAVVFLSSHSLQSQALLTSRPLQSQDRSRYRDFRLASNLASVSTLTGMAATDVKTIHQRPAVMQELEWRPSVLRERIDDAAGRSGSADCLQFL